MALIFIRIVNCLIELLFSFESKTVRYAHVNENKNSLVRAWMVRFGFDWFQLMVRKKVMNCSPADRAVPLWTVLQCLPPPHQGCRLLISTMLAYAGMCWSAPPACTPILTVLIWYFKYWFDKPSVRHVRHIRHTFHQSTTNIPRTNQSWSCCCSFDAYSYIHIFIYIYIHCVCMPASNQHINAGICWSACQRQRHSETMLTMASLLLSMGKRDHGCAHITMEEHPLIHCETQHQSRCPLERPKYMLLKIQLVF